MDILQESKEVTYGVPEKDSTLMPRNWGVTLNKHHEDLIIEFLFDSILEIYTDVDGFVLESVVDMYTDNYR